MQNANIILRLDNGDTVGVIRELDLEVAKVCCKALNRDKKVEGGEYVISVAGKIVEQEEAKAAPASDRQVATGQRRSAKSRR